VALIPPRVGSLSAAYALAALLATGGCGPSGSGRVYVRTGPPPIVAERPIVAPGPAYVWQPGFYRWSGRDYVWVSGRWVIPPGPTAQWVPGHWRQDRHGWFWVEGRWR